MFNRSLREAETLPHPLFFFREVNIKPRVANITKTILPATIKISCGNSPFKMPPKMKLANVNFDKSSNNLPRLSHKSGLGCTGFFSFAMPLLYRFYTKTARKKGQCFNPRLTSCRCGARSLRKNTGVAPYYRVIIKLR